jgi:hypothetical protein
VKDNKHRISLKEIRRRKKSKMNCTTNTKQLTINACTNQIVAWKNYEERERKDGRINAFGMNG